jgi:hypothetical protein
MERDAHQPTGTLTPQEWERVTENLQSLSRELNKVSEETAPSTESRDRKVAA